MTALLLFLLATVIFTVIVLGGFFSLVLIGALLLALITALLQ